MFHLCILISHVFSESTFLNHMLKQSLHAELFAGLGHGKVWFVCPFSACRIDQKVAVWGHYPHKLKRIEQW